MYLGKFTPLERAFIAKSGCQEAYEGEKIPIVEVQNVYELGKLVALSFLEWARANPTGVCALPTGRTPEYFIKTLEFLKKNWNEDSVQAELSTFLQGDLTTFPNLSGLTFVMLDEFFPIMPDHRNSFCHYVDLFYTSPMGITNVLNFNLIAQGVLTAEDMSQFNQANPVDLGLLTKDVRLLNPMQARRRAILCKVQAFCDEFEAKIAALGGIGFFLGGIGPDGHIAFNQPGSAHDSPTRLVTFNYPTAASAATDLGGIENARAKAAMTIGLKTICMREDVTAIIMAAGEGKAAVVRAAVEDPVSIDRPASCLHGKKNAKFYLTHGAASLLTARKAEKIANLNEEEVIGFAMNHLSALTEVITAAHMVVPPPGYALAETLIYNISLACGKPVHKLTVADFSALPEAAAAPEWLKMPLQLRCVIACASRRLREKVEGGLRVASTTNTSILHTGPHHDDIMLSYHAAMHEMLGRNPIGTVFQKGEDGLGEFLPPAASVATSASGGTGVTVPVNTVGVTSVATKGLSRSATPSLTLHKATSFNNLAASVTSIASREPFPLGECFNDNVNHFAYLTSGFHSVNDSFLLKQVKTARGEDGSYAFLHECVINGEVARDYDDVMREFNIAFFARDFKTQDRIENIIFIRKVAEVWAIPIMQSYSSLEAQLRERIDWIYLEYLAHHNPGDAVPKEMQLLKGCMRETEVDRVWACSRMPMNRIHHMRSKFYNDDFFQPMPSIEADALPFANLLRARQPGIITVAFDPEGTGPDTHYKVLQVVAAGLRISLNKGELVNPNPCVLGYRNVWFVFTPSDATLMIPGSSDDLDLMHDTFMSCFTTQKDAQFPSPSYEGPFSAWARHLQKEQKKQLVCLLGEEYFTMHTDPRVRGCSGFVFLKAMNAQTFLREVEELKSKFEIVAKA